MPEPMSLQNASASLRTTVVAAVVEAQRMGATTVEAEHLLLALAADRRAASGVLLEEKGLGHDALQGALAAERAHALRSAGVQPRDARSLAATRIRRPRWGQSARQSLAAAHRRAGAPRGRQRARMAEFDLLGGILSLEFGTVPRALALAGIDRDELRTEVAQRAAAGNV